MMNIQGLMFGSFIIGLAFWPFSGGAQDLARNGQTDYVVVQGDKATEPEKFATQELTNFLSRVTGASFPVVAESSLSGKTRGIYVGWTAYAAREGIEPAKLGEEEWMIRTVGDNLILTGGRPRGTMYAVYEFLERQVGCHWLARDTEVVPSKPTLALNKLNVQGKPWFWRREVSVSSSQSCPDDQWKFLIRNKNYPYNFKGYTNCSPLGAVYPFYGSPGVTHTFSYFVNASNWFDTHPEYFSLDASGKRVPAYNGGGPGQLCLTHPDVRRLTKEKLRAYVAKDRAEAARKGYPPPRIYAIMQNDRYDAHCQCTNCQAIAKREGSESGPLIEFLNEIADDIGKDYPDILIETIAYNLTAAPPKTVKPRSNILIGWCNVYGIRDLARPVNHPYNLARYKEITGWAAAAPRVSIGDEYWIPFGIYARFPTPYCIIQCLGPDLKMFADCHAETFFSESYVYQEAGEHFTVLKLWLAYQLLVNPYQPVDPLIRIFMDGYYGAASSPMNSYLAYLQKRMDQESEYMMTRDAPHNLKYLDVNFFVTAEKLFDEAEASVKPGSREALHIQRERVIADGALLHLWPWLDRKLAANEKMPFDHEATIRRYQASWPAYTKLQYSWYYSPESKQYSKEGRLLEKLAALFRDPTLPEPFRTLPPRDVADFNWTTFSPYAPYQAVADDKEAAGGMAAKFTSVPDAIQAAEKDAPSLAGGKELLKKPLMFGVTGGPTVTLTPEEIPQDGTYHIYRVGRITVRKGTTVWALDRKRLGVCVDRLFVTNASDRAVNDWNAYISLKVKGPAYVKGSAGSNEVWMDRVLLVKPQPGEKANAAELQRQEEQKQRDARRPKVQVPKGAGAGGDPLKVDWEKAVKAGGWSTLKGEATTRKVEGRLAQDGTYLYVRLTETMDTRTLANDAGIFGGDDWELLFSAKRGEPAFRQIGINPDGKQAGLACGESSITWESGATVQSKVDATAWTVSMALPLDRLLPDGVKPGQTLYLNVMRGGKEPLVWSPTFDDMFRVTERMGEVVLE